MNKLNNKITANPISKMDQIKELWKMNAAMGKDIRQLSENNSALVNMIKALASNQKFKEGKMEENSMVLFSDDNRTIFYDSVTILQESSKKKK